MRNKFSEALSKLAKVNKKIYIIVADISPAGKMSDFQKNFSNRYFNVGVAEQAMVGLSAGLAMKGCKPFIYTIAPFTLYRPFEMIRNDLSYQKLNVTIVGMGAGTIYSSLGGTHMSQEDISIARSIPNMQVISPCDPLELEEAVKFCAKNNSGPIYLRIGKSGEKILTRNKNLKNWEFNKIRKINAGKDKCIIGYGPILSLAFDAIKKINKNYSIYSCHTLKPFDHNGLKKIFLKYKKIITLEDHSEIGGLKSIVIENAYQNNFKGKLVSFSLKDKFLNSYERQEDLWEKHGITIKKIIKALKK